MEKMFELSERELYLVSACVAQALYNDKVGIWKFKDIGMATEGVELYKRMRKAQGVDLYESKVN